MLFLLNHRSAAGIILLEGGINHPTILFMLCRLISIPSSSCSQKGPILKPSISSGQGLNRDERTNPQTWGCRESVLQRDTRGSIPRGPRLLEETFPYRREASRVVVGEGASASHITNTRPLHFIPHSLGGGEQRNHLYLGNSETQITVNPALFLLIVWTSLCLENA